MNYCHIDFEYNHVKEEKLNLVCVAWQYKGFKKSYWLHKDPQTIDKVRKEILAMEDTVFVAYNVQAEGRSFLALGLDPTKFKWVDLFLEYRCLTNHSDIMYGKHLIKGKIVNTVRPNLYGVGTKKNNAKPEHTLAAAIFKMLNISIDTAHKTEMRDLIISTPDKFTKKQQEDILEYCESDIEYLPKLLKAVVEKYKKYLNNDDKQLSLLKEEIYLRAEYTARSAIMESLGYPFNYEETKNFADSIEDILSIIAKDINSQFPNIKPFRFDIKDQRFKVNTKNVKHWIKHCPYEGSWERTPKEAYSLAMDAFTKFFKYRHNYPRDNFGAQMLRYLKTKQALYGFRPSLSGKKTFWGYVGSDGRARAYLNPYGSMTARTQPGSTGFIPLKSAWMRSLIQPKQGRALAAIDYGSQEYLLAALVSKDEKMIEAYKTGDVYLAFAKEIKLVPKDATKKSHPNERQMCKSCVLGISYGLSKVGLARDLTQELGRDVSEDEADTLIDSFYDTYLRYADWKEEVLDSYQIKGYLKLPCGWYVWGKNQNDRSVKNFPLQGFGSSIMRKAVALAQDAGLQVPFTLHDAVYIEYDSFDYKAIDVLRQAMLGAFLFYFDGKMKKKAELIRLDCETWGPDYDVKEIKTPQGYLVKQEKIHIDERGEKEYHTYKKYFKKNEVLDIL